MRKVPPALSGLPNTNAKSQRFSYATSQIAVLALWKPLHRSHKSQTAARNIVHLSGTGDSQRDSRESMRESFAIETSFYSASGDSRESRH